MFMICNLQMQFEFANAIFNEANLQSHPVVLICICNSGLQMQIFNEANLQSHPILSVCKCKLYCVKTKLHEANSQTHPMMSICTCVPSLQIRLNVKCNVQCSQLCHLTLARTLLLADADDSEVTTIGQSA